MPRDETRRGMRPFVATLPLADARAVIDREVRGIDGVERVPLETAVGRVLAADVASTLDVPAFDRAAMDGYAVRAADTAGATREAPRRLRLVDQVFTGQVPTRALSPIECIEVATGAPLPDGADAVVMVEDTTREADAVLVGAPVVSRQHVGRRGADIAEGQAVLARGDVLLPGRVGALAAVGASHVEVYARPRVAIFSTGNEIAAPGRPLAPGQVYDINRFTLGAIVREHGGVPVPHAAVGDTIDDLRHALDASAGADLIMFSGGSSVGERDLLVDVLAESGDVFFHGIAVKPGKPTAFGRVRGVPVLGMPGYPTSCLSNGYILLIPILRRLARLPAHVPKSVRMPLERRVVSAPGRHQFYTVRLAGGMAVPAFKASGDITSMSRADGYFEIPAEVEAVEAGALVDVQLF